MTDQERKQAFSRNLLNILGIREKSQVEVAKAIGVSQQTFNTWCRGVALPRMGKIQLLADYFNINMSELIECGTAAPASSPSGVVSMELYPDEAELVGAYRASPPVIRNAARRVLGLKEDGSSSSGEDGEFFARNNTA